MMDARHAALSETPEAGNEAASVVVRSADAAVRLGGQTIWSGLELSVQSGEFLAILGPNGAGKSTLLKAILGLLPLAGGTLTVFGGAVHRGNAAIGYLPQRQLFDPDVRVRGRDLVRLGLDGTRWGIPLPAVVRFGAARARTRAEAGRVAEAIERVGATGYADRPVGELSGGEQQRLLLAQTLVTQPRLLLLDEPFEGLDLPSQQAVAALIRVGSAARAASPCCWSPTMSTRSFPTWIACCTWHAGKRRLAHRRR